MLGAIISSQRKLSTNISCAIESNINIFNQCSSKRLCLMCLQLENSSITKMKLLIVAVCVAVAFATPKVKRSPNSVVGMYT